MDGLLDLDLFSEYGGVSDADTDNSIYEDMEFIESFIQLLTESALSIMAECNMDDEEELTESTALTRHAHKLKKDYDQMSKNLESIEAKMKEHKRGTFAYRELKDKKKNLEGKLKELRKKLDKDYSEGHGKKKRYTDPLERGKEVAELRDKAAGHYGKNAAEYKKGLDDANKRIEDGKADKDHIKKKFNTEPEKEKEPGRIAKLNKNLEKISESFDEILEEAEFDSGSYATADVDNGVKDGTVNVPGGTGESPSAKQKDGKEIPVPGGDKETPTANPYDKASITIPSSVTMTDSQWKEMLNGLQKSFKEGVELLQILSEATVIHKTEEELQNEYTESMVENAIGEAILEAYENGPIFEAVKRSDKKNVKDITKSLRGKIPKDLKDKHISFYKPSVLARILGAAAGVTLGGIGSTAGTIVAATGHPIIGGAIAATTVAAGSVSQANLPAALQQIWTTRLWQVIGICHMEEGNIGEVTKMLTEKYKDELGEYKILYVKAIPALLDALKTKFNWKNSKGAYFLLVDRTIPKDIKEFQDTFKKVVEEKENNSEGEDKKEDKEE